MNYVGELCSNEFLRANCIRLLAWQWFGIKLHADDGIVYK